MFLEDNIKNIKDNNEYIEEYKKSPMYEGLVRLNNFLTDKNYPPMHLNAIGGFAMISLGLKASYTTDIDYVGKDLPEDIKIKADEIGENIGLGRGWINNDVMLSGSTLSEFEISTGKLHFNKAFDLGKISVSILDIKDLLRMKVIAIDTSLAAVELGGDFTRIKDLPDIKAIMDKRDMDILSLELETYMYNINNETYELIEEYLRNPNLSELKEKMDKKSASAALIESWEKEMEEIEKMLKNEDLC